MCAALQICGAKGNKYTILSASQTTYSNTTNEKTIKLSNYHVFWVMCIAVQTMHEMARLLVVGLDSLPEEKEKNTTQQLTTEMSRRTRHVWLT